MPTGTAAPRTIDRASVRRARSRSLGNDDATRLSALLAILGDPVRVRLLDALQQVGELCVGDLAAALDLSEDSASYGLRVLRTAGLVQTRKDGRVVYYRLAERFPEPLLEHCLRELLHLGDVAAGRAGTGAGRRR